MEIVKKKLPYSQCCGAGFKESAPDNLCEFCDTAKIEFKKGFQNRKNVFIWNRSRFTGACFIQESTGYALLFQYFIERDRLVLFYIMKVGLFLIFKHGVRAAA